jgi:hypothetical protein
MLRYKLAATFLAFENTALYFLLGVFLAFLMDFHTLLTFITPTLLTASALETLFYRYFIFFDEGETDIARFNIFVKTLFTGILWLYAGYAFGRVYLLEVVKA